MSYNSRSNRARNFKSASRFALVRFWNYSRDYSLNWTPLGPITITNRIYNKILDRDWCSARLFVTWVSNYRSPIWTFCIWMPVIAYPCVLHVNHGRFNGFLSNVFYSFQNLGKVLQTFLLKRSSHKTFLIPKFVIWLICNWTSCHTTQGVIILVISNRPHASR